MLRSKESMISLLKVPGVGGYSSTGSKRGALIAEGSK